jgi:hypothetical protein
MCQNWFTIVRGWVMCQTGSRLFVVGSVCQNWFTIVRGWFMSKLVHDCSWFKSIRLAILTPKTLKKMRLVPFYVYIYTVCRLCACRLYTR